MNKKTPKKAQQKTQRVLRSTRSPFFYVAIGSGLTLFLQFLLAPQTFSLRGQLLNYEICGDSIDNDGNGQVDCADTACTESASCIKREECGDGIDNDENGAIDCADAACAESPICTHPEACADGVDNDYDGFIDCMDSECYGNPLCPRPEVCGDGIDNDVDGYIDCADIDCELSPVCPMKEICDDGVDNDENGATDCADDACAIHVFCTKAPEPAVGVIREVIEREVERIVEIEAAAPAQPAQRVVSVSGAKERKCTDGVDNDGNGRTDCEDENCASHPRCISVVRKALTEEQREVEDE